MPQSRPQIHKDKEKDAPARASVLPEDVPPEFRVLLSACRVFLGTEEPARLEALLGQGPDWDRLLALASRHGVMPLLYRSLGKIDRKVVPQEWLARLRAIYMQNAAKNIKMTMELLRILDALKEAGIKAVPLKGPVLAQQLYGDVALRQFSDLDILVAPEDVKNAQGVIKKKGYSGDELSQSKSTALLKTVPHCDLYNKNLKIKVELHWRITANFYCLPSDVALLLNRAESINIEGTEMHSVSSHDLLLMLCQHGARHSWESLSWICDVAGLLKTASNWRNAFESDKSVNSRAYLLGFILVRDLLNVEFPIDIVERLEREEQLKKYARGVIKQFILDEMPFDDHQLREINRNYYYMNMFGTSADKIKCFLSLATSPTSAEFSAIELPDRMLPMYRIVRPLRLMYTYVKGAWERI